MNGEESTRIILAHAHEYVAVLKRKKKHRLKKFISHKSSRYWESQSTSEKVGMGIGLAMTGAGVIAAVTLTGGVAVGVIAGIAGGKYLIGKISKKIRKRRNRNWLAEYSGAFQSETQGYQKALNTEARDAIRRAVDHFNQCREALKYVKFHREQPGWGTCNGAIAYAKTVCAFIHHSDKTRNYVLPCVDLCIFLIDQIVAMHETWDQSVKSIENGLISWFDYHDSTLVGHCSRNNKDICYGSLARGNRLRNPHPDVRGNGHSTATKKPGSGSKPVDLVLVKNHLQKATVRMEDLLSRGGNAPTTHHGNLVTRRLEVESAPMKLGLDARLKRLVNDVFKRVNEPGSMARARRNISHRWSRSTKMEKIGSGIDEAINLGGLATPFLPTMEVAKVGVSLTVKNLTAGGFQTGSTLNTVLSNYIDGVINENQPFFGNLVDMGAVTRTSAKELVNSGAQVQDLLLRVSTHFKNALQYGKEIEEVQGARIQSCTEAWELAKTYAFMLHELKKMEVYLATTLFFLLQMVTVLEKWSELEGGIWAELIAELKSWLRHPSQHILCRNRGTRCYGPKEVKKSFHFSRRRKREAQFEDNFIWNMPHHPM